MLNIEIEAANLDIVPDTELSNLNIGILRKKINIQTPESLDYYYFAFNINQKPTSDVRFRKAILHSFDFNTFIKDLFKTNNGGIRAYSPIPPSLWPQDLDYQSNHLPKYDPELAKKLFKQLEEEKILDRTKPLIIAVRGKRYRTIIMKAMANNLAYQYGFNNVHFKVITDWNKFQKTIPESHMHSFGMGLDNPDPNIDIFGENQYNYFKYRNPDIDKWLKAEHQESTREKRAPLLVKIMRKALYQDFVWGMLFHKRTFFLTSKRINGLVVSGVGYFFVYNPFDKAPVDAYLENE